MIIIVRQEASQEAVTGLIQEIEAEGLKTTVVVGTEKTIVGVVGDTRRLDDDRLLGNAIVAEVKHISDPFKRANRAFHPDDTVVDVNGVKGDTRRLDDDRLLGNAIVAEVKHISDPFKRANRAFHPDDTVVDVNGVKIGGGHFAMIAGPCSVETHYQIIEVARAVKASGATMLRGGAFKPRTSPYDFQGLKADGIDLLLEAKHQIIEVARAVKASGATMLRGGAFKPRTSPYDFQGLKADGIDLLLEAKRETGLPIVTEIMNINHLPLFENVDVIQVGARSMQHFEMLRELGKQDKPILLKRGLANTIKELLMAAEYVMSSGNTEVILCERGIRTFETATRNTLDLSAIAVLHEKTHLPVMAEYVMSSGNTEVILCERGIRTFETATRNTLDLSAIAVLHEKTHLPVIVDPSHATGVAQVILCERGIRTFETATRNTLDLSAIAVLHEKTHLPVIVDPSHATGVARYVKPMAAAAAAAGADGLIIEVHNHPAAALCDGAQSLTPAEFETGVARYVKPMAAAAAAAGADGLIIEVHNHPAAALCDGAQSLTPAEFEETAKLVNAVRGAVGTVAGY